MLFTRFALRRRTVRSFVTEVSNKHQTLKKCVRKFFYLSEIPDPESNAPSRFLPLLVKRLSLQGYQEHAKYGPISLALEKQNPETVP